MMIKTCINKGNTCRFRLNVMKTNSIFIHIFIRGFGDQLFDNSVLVASSLGLLRVSEYSDIRGSEFKIEYEYSSLPKSLDRDLFFFFLPFLLLKQEVFHKMVH